jgi:hypothetical protein
VLLSEYPRPQISQRKTVLSPTLFSVTKSNTK